MLKNSRTHYGWITITLHWVMALSIFGMFGLGVYMVDLTYYDQWYKGSLDLHKSIGMLLLIVFIFRLGWRAINITPESVDTDSPHFLKVIAHLTHIVLYLLMATLLISGYLISTADGRGISIFEIVTIPAIPFSIDNQEDIAGLVHEVLAWGLILLALVHTFAALKHHFINKNKTLVRMFNVNINVNNVEVYHEKDITCRKYLSKFNTI